MLRAVVVTIAAIFAGLAVVIGAIVGAVAVAVTIYDKNDLKQMAAGFISRSIDRELEINGDADVDVGWVSRLRVENIVLANVPWSKEPTMAQIDALDVSINLRELLHRRVVLPVVEISKPRILLEKNAQGEANWQFTRTAKATAESAAPEKRSEIPVVERLAIDGAQLRYRDAATKRSIDLDLASLTVTDDSADRSVSVKGNGSYQGGPLQISFAGGSWAALQQTEDPYPVDADVRLGDLKVKAKGTVTDVTHARGLDLGLDVAGENAANLFDIIGVALPPSPPYRVSGTVDHAGTEWKFTDAAGKLGDSNIRGNFGIDTGRERLYLNADFESDRLNFNDLGPFIGAKSGGPPPKAKEPEVARTDGRVLPNAEIDLSRLNAMDADIVFKAHRIEATQLPFDRLSTNLSLNAGTLQLKPAEIGIGKGTIRVFMTLNGTQKPVHSDIDLQVQRVALKELVRGSDFVNQSAGTLGGQAKLQATGTSVAQIAGSATGNVFVVMAGGEMSHLLVELAGLDIAESLGVAIGGDKSIPIRCVVIDLEAQQGVFNTRSLVIDTTDTNIAGTGTINMRDEKLDLTLYPLSKDWSPLSMRAPISIEGSFAAPTAFPDPAGIGVDSTVKKVVDAILTPILGLLPPIDAGVGKDSDCQQLINRAKSAG